MATVRYLAQVLGFKLEQSMAPAFARVSKKDLTLWLAGPKSSAARFVVEVDDLVARAAEMKRAGARFRNEIVVGPGDGNVVELFEPAD